MPQYQGIWTLAQQAQAQSNQQWVTDPYFKNTTLLLQADGTGSGSQNQTFLDSSTSNLYVNRYGNATQGSFSPHCKPDGQWSNYQSSVDTNYINFTTSPGTLFQFAGDFTIEAWIYPNALTVDASIWVTNDGSANYFAWNIDSTNFNVYLNSSGATSSFAHGVSLNQWSHVAMVRSGSTITVYTNGVSKGTLTSSATLGYSSPSIARNGGGGSSGQTRYQSNLRIVKSAVYTSAFTPPTTPLTNIPNTSLLTCQSNRFVDNSSNALVATVTGTPTVQAFAPFAPSLQWTPEVVGGSAYLDGTGDYLDVGVGAGFDLGSSNFSMEFWYYATAVGTYAPGIICKRVGGVATGWAMGTSGFVALVGGTWYDSWGNPYWVGSTSATGFNSSTSLTKMNQWTHVVVTRTGTDVRWFVNGQLLGYQSRSGSIDQLTGSRLSIGLMGTTSEQPFYGYISDLRISIGSVPTGYQTSSTTLNTQIFTPPTAAITKTSQGATSGDVKYIGNSTNAGIYDATMNTNFETVNADISVTSIPAKYGSGSLSFNSTSTGSSIPYLLSAANTNRYALYTGDFTMEAWIFILSNNNLSSDMPIINYGNGGANGPLGTATTWALLVTNNGAALKFYRNTDASTEVSYSFGSASTVPYQKWVHVAITRANGYMRAFVDGVQVGSTTAVSTSYAPVSGTNRLFVGVQTGGGGNNEYYKFPGFMDDVRLTQGVARYIANFTPPQQALPRQ